MKTPPTHCQVISVSGMAKLLKMSRSQFYNHVERGTFPQPLYLDGDRPYYDRERIEMCLTARTTGVGANGQYVLFYAPRTASPNRVTKPRPSSKDSIADNLLDGLTSLGLNVTKDQVEAAVAVVYPGGVAGIDESQILRAVFRHLKSLKTA